MIRPLSLGRRGRRRWPALALLALLAVVSAAACSSSNAPAPTPAEDTPRRDAGEAGDAADGPIDGSIDGSIDASAPQRCQTDADCDDGSFCDGAERCGADGACLDGVPPCDDGLPCTDDRCVEETAACTSVPVHERCDAPAWCDSGAGCTSEVPPPGRTSPVGPERVAPLGAGRVPVVRDEALVLAPDGTTAREVQDALDDLPFAARVIGALASVPVYQVLLPGQDDTSLLPARLASIEALPGVRRALPHFAGVRPARLPPAGSDSDYVSAGALTPDAWHLAAIRAPEAWEMTTGGDEARIGLVDTGFRVLHEDLAPNLDACLSPTSVLLPACTPTWMAPLAGADDPDGRSHGTLVAGLIAAEGASTHGNAADVVGVLWRAKMTLSRGSIDLVSWLSQAEGHVGAGARIVNLSAAASWSVPDADGLLPDPASAEASLAVETHAALFGELVQAHPDVLFVQGAGNDGALGVDARLSLLVCAVDEPALAARVLCVAGSLSDGTVAPYSNAGGDLLAAPGGGAQKPIVGLGYEPNALSAGSGTSFAAALVTGTAGLMRSVHPDIAPETTHAILLAAGPAATAGPDGAWGDVRLLDAEEAVRRALQCASAPFDPATASCPTCVPNCDGRVCGPDPVCGLSCGGCPADDVCHDGCVDGACVPALAEETACDGVDEDCDGETDDGLVDTCLADCGVGERHCEAGGWTECDCPLPNLVIVSATEQGPTGPCPTTWVDVVVRNEGSAVAFVDPPKLVRGTPSGSSNDATPNQEESVALPPGDTLTVRLWVNIPHPQEAPISFTFTVDPAGAIAESDETDNEFDIVVPVPVPPDDGGLLPDLVVSEFHLSPNPAQLSDDDLGYGVEIRNDGPGTAWFCRTWTYVVEPEGGGPGNGTITTTSLAPGETLTGGQLFPYGASELGVGTFVYVATADPDDEVLEVDETNNTRSAALVVQPYEGEPDLVITGAEALDGVGPCPPTKLQVEILNQGNGIAALDRPHLAAGDPTGSIGDATPHETDIIEIAPGETTTTTLWVSVPRTLDAPFEILITVDPEGDVAESDEDNNTWVHTVPVPTVDPDEPLPDLAVRFVELFPSPAALADEIGFDMEIVNLGPGPAYFCREWPLAVESTDLETGGGTITTARLDPGDSLGHGQFFNLTGSDLGVGLHEFVGVADPDDVVAETDETNNTMAVWLQVGPIATLRPAATCALPGAPRQFTIDADGLALDVALGAEPSPWTVERWEPATGTWQTDLHFAPPPDCHPVGCSDGGPELACPEPPPAACETWETPASIDWDGTLWRTVDVPCGGETLTIHEAVPAPPGLYRLTLRFDLDDCATAAAQASTMFWVADCDDGVACTEDGCDDEGNCERVPHDSACNDGSPCTADRCDLLEDCQHEPLPGTCTDQDPCTLNDACVDGACVGTPRDCDDGDVCTDDLCGGTFGTCTHPFNTAACDDGDPCTERDGCGEGTCAGTPVDCDDANSCTLDACDPGSGACAHAPATGACDDGDPCTENDACAESACVGAPIDCDDDDPCTDDGCDEITRGCVHAPNAAPCDDGEPCTARDRCADGVCGGSPRDCDDADPCTADDCEPGTGCVYAWAEGPCDDENACTERDRCTDGVCGGSPRVCDDGDVCTEDGCDPASGCTTTGLDGPICDDGDPCTVRDLCVGGVCVTGTPKDCGDGVACTADGCEAETGLCAHTANDALCDDGVGCTEDRCDLADGCLAEPDDAQCDDGVPCTTDACDAVLGCVATPDDAQCSTDDECLAVHCDVLLGCVPALAEGSCGVCGDGVCASDCAESYQMCPTDCSVCGDGFCTTPESIASCPEDCCGTCGDKRCASPEWGCAETVDTCPGDCRDRTCGDAVCEPGENPENCPDDCAHFECGNGTCEPGEDPESCPDDCATVCGDCVCEAPEDAVACPQDCGYCGDGHCNSCPGRLETMSSCFVDCGGCDGACDPADPESCCTFCCLPACEGRSCGPDGCGGTCGFCVAGAACVDGICVQPPQPAPFAGAPPVPLPAAPRAPGETCGDGICQCEEDALTCQQDCCGVCGDGVCDTRCFESVEACPEDCRACGDGTCSPGEGPDVCPLDCCGFCGDAKCANYADTACNETNESCAKDCGGTACGNGECEPGENPVVCAADCAHFACGNRTCEPGESQESCPVDCASVCGDCSCDGAEDWLDCPIDCGFCGDGYCSTCSALGESSETCPMDCGTVDCVAGCAECAGDTACCTFVPCLTDCGDRECGGSCAGLCGVCEPGFACRSGYCECVSTCSLQTECGDDGCGGVCGTCPTDDPCRSTCDADRRCGPVSAFEASCDGEDEDCDGVVDDEFLVDGVFALDAHCGACGNDCTALSYPNADTGRCAIAAGEAACVPACDEGWGDADGESATGCECPLGAEPDTVGDGVDQNCDGADGVDADRDGHADAPSGGDDCDDGDDEVFAGAVDFVDGACAEFVWLSVVVPTGEHVVSRAALALDAEDAVHLVVSYSDTRELGYVRSTGRGAWEIETIAPEGGIGSARALALDAAGHAHVAFAIATLDEQGLTTDRRMVYATNASGAWVTTTVDDPPGEMVGGHASIALTGDPAADRSIHIAYQDSTRLTLKYATNVGGAFVAADVEDDLSLKIGEYSCIAAGPSARVAVSTYDDTEWGYNIHQRQARVYTKSGTDWLAQTVELGSYWGRYTGLAFDSGGAMHISYTRSSTVVHGERLSTGWLPTAISNGNGSFTTIAVGADDHPHVAWKDESSHGLAYAARDAAGLWTRTVVDAEAGSGRTPSIAVGADGRVRIAHGFAVTVPAVRQELRLVTSDHCARFGDERDRNCDGVDGVDADGDDVASVATGGTDCDDTDDAIFPGQTGDEVGDGVDQDCDGLDGVDADGDGHASLASGGDDCDDTDGAVNPGVLDPVGDAFDANCDGHDGVDADQDGHASEGSGGGDCDDDDPEAFPGADDWTDGTCHAWNDDWSTTETDAQGQYVGAGLDPAGRLHIVTNQSSTLRHWTQAADGTWEGELVVQSTGFFNANAVAVDGDGHVHIAGHGGGVSHVSNATGAWGKDVVDAAGRYPALAVDAGGAVHLCYEVYDLSTYSTRTVYATDASGAWVSTNVDLASGPGQTCAVAFGPDGAPHLSYAHSTSPARVYHATLVAGAWVVTEVDPDAAVTAFEHTTLGVDPAGDVHIAHVTASNARLRYLTNATGEWTGEDLDPEHASSYAYYPDLAIDGEGHVVLTYWRSYSAYTLFSADTVTGAWRVREVAQVSYGGRSALALTAEGQAHVAYVRSLSSDLSYARNVACTAAGDARDLDCDGVDGHDGDRDQWAAEAWGGADCDDGDPAFHPGADDPVGDGLDQDCNGVDGSDADGDGHDSLISGGDDCDDADETIFPGAPDTVGDAIDQDCDGLDGVDGDDDGYASEASGGDDCDDANPDVHPAMADTVGNGVDDNCDGVDGVDGDGDEHATLLSGGDDCDDSRADRFPGNEDTVGDGVDNDCDGLDGVDGDDDQYASLASGGDDCDDSAPDIHPGLPDPVGDGVDQNCDGADGIDGDRDGALAAVSGGDDCDDANPDRYVGAPDSVGDGVDQNCDGVDGVDGDGDRKASVASGGGDCDDEAPAIFPGATDGPAETCRSWAAAWRTETVAVGLVNTSAAPSIALDAAGFAHVSLRRNNRLTYATNASGVWVLTELSTSTTSGARSAIAVDATGAAHVASWYSRYSWLEYMTNAGGSWAKGQVDMTRDSNGRISIAVDGLAHPHIAYYDATTARYDLWYATRTGAGVGGWTAKTADTAAAVGSDNAIAVDAGGQVHISYYDATTDDLKYATNPSGYWTTEVVDAAGDVGVQSAIAVDAAGLVHIAYRDATNGDLRYAVGGAGAWTVTTVAAAGDVGTNPSLAVDRLGFVHLLHRETGTPSTLHYVTNASGAWETVHAIPLVDGAAALAASLALDAKGRAHVVWFDNDLLEVRYTTNADCDAFETDTSACNDIDDDCDGTTDEDCAP